MGLFEGIRAAANIQKIKRGGVAKLSVSQIVNMIINLPDAKRKLPQEKYMEILGTYMGMRTSKVKIPMNMDMYCDITIKIIKEFDLIAPYEKYCGGGEFEYSLLMEDIFGKHHKRIRELRRQIADMETKLKERDASDAENAKIYAEAYTDEQLTRMVSRGELSISRANEYKESRKSLGMMVDFAPTIRKNTILIIEDLKKELADLERTSN